MSKYPLTWASCVVYKLYHAYPRATEILLQITGISLKYLAVKLADGSPCWAQWRNTVHFVDKWLSDTRVPYTTSHLVSALRQKFALQDRKWLLEALDDVDRKRMLQEQVLRGTRGGGHTPPLYPDLDDSD